ncbi:hypothetical protein [Ferruginivarius sediminum]|uniref:Uncharacterized protein n=1 Tax=Ferruginivarius sediminum TaxID=2661937 RepID=A0A369T5H3_9PROT|nr:hypothetical protein [Ferruginivarius sediminum]RDD60583.1 hypothetical protein DRB17_17500 [Ferruginivarius sediminum]
MARIRVRVECYAGHRGEQEPRRFFLGQGERAIQVVAILDRWIGPDHRYFKLTGDDHALYILRHDETAGEWEMTFYDARGGTTPGGGSATG